MGWLDEYESALKQKLSSNSSSGNGSSNASKPTSTSSWIDEYYNSLGQIQKRTTMNHQTVSPILSPEKIVQSSKRKNDEEERTWFKKGLFADGYDLFDVTKTIIGTGADVAEDLATGILGLGEKGLDTLAYLAPYIIRGTQTGTFNPDAAQKYDDMYNQAKNDAAKFVAGDLYDEEAVAAWLIGNQVQGMTGFDVEEASILGARSDALVQSAGQLAAQYGLQAVGVPWFVTSGVSTFGSEAENALNSGATYGEAGLSATISAGAEILSEWLFGGDLFVGKSGSDLAATMLTRSIADKGWRTFLKLGGDVLGEGAEEVFSEMMSNLGSSLYKEEHWLEILFNEEALDEYLESFIGGAVLGGAMGGINAYKSGKSGVDYASGMRDSEKAVVDKLFQDRLAEAEKDGGKLSTWKKNKLYESVIRDMDRGYISTDTIEEVLGGESYSNYKKLLQSDNDLLSEYDSLGAKKDATLQEQSRYAELTPKVKGIMEWRNKVKSQLDEDVYGIVKGTRLGESYNERSRRGEAFQADLTKYNPKQRAIVQRAIDSGILNNTNRTHDFVDVVARISADKGVSFDFTNNAKLKESGFAIDGATVDGYVTKDGISINIDSPKAWQSTVGHEITHVLEGTEFYSELQQMLFSYAEKKGVLGSRRSSIQNRYKNIKGANFDAELTADLVGEYLFTDEDFVNNLSANHRNIFQKIYDEIKYLGKIVTAGSQQARDLERVKRVFEKAYREGKNMPADTKYSLSDSSKTPKNPGRYSTPATDLRIEKPMTAPSTDADLIPNTEHIPETDADNIPDTEHLQTEAEMVSDDYAPAAAEDAARQSERNASLDDADAPPTPDEVSDEEFKAAIVQSLASRHTPGKSGSVEFEGYKINSEFVKGRNTQQNDKFSRITGSDRYSYRIKTPTGGILRGYTKPDLNALYSEVFDRITEDKKSRDIMTQQGVDEGIAPVKDGAYVVQDGQLNWDEQFVGKKTSGKTARVRTESSNIQKKRFRKLEWAKEHLLDNGMVFEDVAKKFNNRNLEAKWHMIRNSFAKAQRMIGNGSGAVKSLNSIRAEVEKSGEIERFYNYMYHKHNVDRMSLAFRGYGDNKAVFGDHVTSAMSAREVAEYEKHFPEFKKWAQEVYDYMGNLRKLLLDSDVISQDTADLWAEMYPHYVPLRRVGQDGLNATVPLDTNKTDVNAPIMRATGGNQDIEPLFDTMAQRTLQTYRAIAKNRFGIELKNTLGSTIEHNRSSVDDVLDSLDMEDVLLKPGENGGNPTFTVFENGERVEFEITNEMYEAMKPRGRMASARIPVLSTLNEVFRKLTTEYNPVFMLTNPIKDVQDVLLNSQHPAKTYANLGRSIWQQISDGYYYQEYIENGGESNSYFDGENNTFTEESPLSKWNLISRLNNHIEMTPRLAEYIASRESGENVDVAMLNAARVTTNFAAGGDVTKFFNRNGVTFLNASVQGAVQQVRNVREAHQKGFMGYVGLVARTAVAGIPAMILNNIIWDDDEEYQNLADYVKQDFYIVGKTDDGKFLRIPKGRAVSVIQDAMQQVINGLTGNDEVDLGNFLKLAAANLAPNNPFTNNLAAPLFQVWNNKTWYGEDLVPTRLQDVPKTEQFDEKTDKFSVWLSQTLNEVTGGKVELSPYQMNYLLNQYSGGLGDFFLPMMTPRAETGDDSDLGWLTAPFRDKFSTDSVLNSQIVSDFYDKQQELTMLANSKNATQEDVFRSMYMDSVSYSLNDLYAQKREIQSSDLPDSEKYQQVRAIQQEINDIMQHALDSYNNVNIDGMYAEVGDVRYNYDKGADRWYEIKPKNADGTDNWYYKQEQKVTEKFGISYGEYWNNKADYDLKYEDPETHAFLKMIGISAESYGNMDYDTRSAYRWAAEDHEGYNVAKNVFSNFVDYRKYMTGMWDLKADKDENGKSINGTRKTKVLDYVMGLDIEYGQKVILFKSEYPADDTYNYDIIDYLNGRDDISFDEMNFILRYLGFNVDADGYITW